MKYRQLTMCARSQIYALMSTGCSARKIAAHLDVAPSTISRELRRNRGPRGYRHQQANRFAIARKSNASTGLRKWTAKLEATVIWALSHHQWSPEQIAGRLALREPHRISHERIYTFIRADRAAGGKLYQHLRHSGRKYRKRSKLAGKSLIPNRVDITERESIIEHKVRIGDFEGDTVLGKGHQTALLTLVDRTSKFTLIDKLTRRCSATTAEAMSKRLMQLPVQLRKTCTLDNGLEFARHEQVTAMTGVRCFFARPYAPHQRGLNEHTNGLIRQYLPKGHDLGNISHAHVRYIEDKINNRPRKVLGYKTPREVFNELALNEGVALAC